MNTFIVNAEQIETLTSALRHSAAQLTNVPATAPGFGPTATFAAALSEAVTHTNTRAHQVRREAHRLADVMELTTAAATSVDDGLARTLKGLHP